MSTTTRRGHSTAAVPLLPVEEIFIKVTDPDGNLGDHPVVILVDGEDTTIRFQL
ncbi:unnamed protein product, partial [marine sediment metagenome]